MNLLTKAELAIKLEETQQELRALKKEYEDFAYIVSHDLSSPFRTIEGFSKIIEEKNGHSFDEKTRQHFQHIMESTKRGKATLAALLELSRLNTHRETPSECNCELIIETIKQQLSLLMNQSNASIECYHLPILIGDQKEITLLFYHLIHNALLYRSAKKPTIIKISCEDGENYWKFSIQDNGIGIKESLTEKVFKAFRRGVSQKKYPGLGMGLTIAKKITQNHGGNISLVTTVGSGTTVYFNIAKDLSSHPAMC